MTYTLFVGLLQDCILLSCVASTPGKCLLWFVSGVLIQAVFFCSHRPGKPRLYFYAGFLAYILGLLTTIGVMHFFKAAQPALLYLVPSCLGIPFLAAMVKGDLPALIGSVVAVSMIEHCSLVSSSFYRYRDYPTAPNKEKAVPDEKKD